ncbi:MAG: hypothetical protein MZW92_28660 [Comamonadaceae bacterium]|nr:hypothetical protein [Comamonadaceae bacterium]
MVPGVGRAVALRRRRCWPGASDDALGDAAFAGARTRGWPRYLQQRRRGDALRAGRARGRRCSSSTSPTGPTGSRPGWRAGRSALAGPRPRAADERLAGRAVAAHRRRARRRRRATRSAAFVAALEAPGAPSALARAGLPPRCTSSALPAHAAAAPAAAARSWRAGSTCSCTC